MFIKSDSNCTLCRNLEGESTEEDKMEESHLNDTQISMKNGPNKPKKYEEQKNNQRN